MKLPQFSEGDIFQNAIPKSRKKTDELKKDSKKEYYDELFKSATKENLDTGRKRDEVPSEPTGNDWSTNFGWVLGDVWDAVSCNFGRGSPLQRALSNVAQTLSSGFVSSRALESAAKLQLQAREIVDSGVQLSKKSAGEWYEAFLSRSPMTSCQFVPIQQFRSRQTIIQSPCDFQVFSMPPIYYVTGRSAITDAEAACKFNRKCGVDINLNLLELDETTHGNALVEVGCNLLSPYLKSGVLECTTYTLHTFLGTLQANYSKANPYHNHIHGAEVAHLTFAFADRIKLFSSAFLRDFEQVLIIVAALAHDVGHPGVNNGFLVKTLDPLAIVYNDRSVLENYHACKIFHIMSMPECDIFAFEGSSNYQRGRAKIIDMILATDMAEHISSVSTFRLRRLGVGINSMKKEDDAWETIKMCLKMADLGHSVLEWKQHQEWSNRVTEEFYLQGDREIQRDLVVSALCDRQRHADMAKSQCLFLQYVVLPLLAELTAFDSRIRLRYQLQLNQKKWEALVAEQEEKKKEKQEE